MVKWLQCLALYNMYTITCFGSNDVVSFLSLRSHESQHHPSSFLSNISHWSSLSPSMFMVILQPTRTQQNSREISNLVKNNWIELGCKEMGAGVGRVGVVTQSSLSLSLSPTFLLLSWSWELDCLDIPWRVFHQLTIAVWQCQCLLTPSALYFPPLLPPLC
jgi:hypothetical protein